jgi:hypothetical protein
VRDQVSGHRTAITAIVLGGHRAPVRLFFRRHGIGGFYHVRMRHKGPRGVFVGRIPARAATPDGIDYYIKVGRGRSYDPVLARHGQVYHGIGVQLPEIKHPLRPRL